MALSRRRQRGRMQLANARAELTRQMERARHALGVERAVPLVMIPLAALMGWAAFALFGLHGLLPPLAASLAAIAALAGLGYLIIRSIRAWRRPTEQDARRRLAKDAGIDPGSFDALEDQPSQLDPTGLALWGKAQERALAAASKAAASPARLQLNKVDPLRLRYVAAILVVAGAVVAGAQAPDRIAAAFLPDPGPFVGDKPMTIEGWAAPAGYTGAAPVPLADKIGAKVATPPSVEVTLRVTGPVAAPKLVFESLPGQGRGWLWPETIKASFKRAADGAWEARLTIPREGTLRVVRFHTKARWRIAPAPDLKPKAKFVAPPTLKDDLVTLTWAAEDDFGVRSAFLAISPVRPMPGLVNAAPLRTQLNSPQSEPKAVEQAAEVDLLAHPYAGLDVYVSVVARDAMGQEGSSDRLRMKLPEKIFLQPLAQAAIEVRKEILWERRAYAAAKPRGARGQPYMVNEFEPVWGVRRLLVRTDDQDPRLERAPPGIRAAVRRIDALTVAPEDGYFADPAVFAGFKAARAMLAFAGSIDETNAAADVLWEVASRAEYGDAADAKRAMEMAQKAMMEALARGASPEEIERLSKSLRDATQAYMRAMVEEAIREGKRPSNEDQMAEQGQSLSQNDIDQMMREVERLAKEGRTEEAQALMQQLAEMMQNMEVQLASGPGGQGEDQQQQKLNQEIEELGDAMAEQRQLRDETQRREQQEQQGQQQQGQQSAPSPGQLADQQEQLRRQLEKAQQGMDGKDGEGDGEGQGRATAKKELGQAGEAMGQAENALRRGDMAGAQRSQDQALRALRRGAEALSRDAMAQSGEGQQAGEREGTEPASAAERDPLGRVIGGAGEGEDVGVPDAPSKERAREILDELRRRAQDPNRPEAEREYLRRLLERFSGA